MVNYLIEGTFKMGDNFSQPFRLLIDAKDKNAAKERAFAELGAKHKCPRRFIKIAKIERFKNG